MSTVTRRGFLRSSAAGIGAALAGPYVVPGSVFGRNAPSNRITLGIIGCGNQSTVDIPEWLKNDDCQIVAVCDVNKASYGYKTDKQFLGREPQRDFVNQFYAKKTASGLFQGCDMIADFRELLARKDIDAVCITTQDHWHALIAIAAAKAGKDMYCQKPLGTTVQECQAIRSAVRQNNRVFQTGTQQRSDRSFRFACELARNGYLGKIHTVEVAAPGPMYKRRYDKPTTPEPVPSGFDFDMYTGPAKARPYNGGLWAWPDWYLIRDYCVGFIVNWGVHHLDIANWGCPSVASEPCELEFTGHYRNDGLTDNINDWRGEFRYDSGLRMTYSDTGNPNQQGCLFRGDKGWVHVNRSRSSFEPESLRSVEIRSDEIDLAAGATGSHYHNFIQCVRSRKDPIAPVEAGFQASYLGMIAEISIRLGRKLKWNPATEKFVDDEEANQLLSAPMRSPWHL